MPIWSQLKATSSQNVTVTPESHSGDSGSNIDPKGGYPDYCLVFLQSFQLM
jgi:hypothetical protein